MRVVRQIAYDMADAVVFQTPDAKTFFPKRTQNKSVVIPNPLSQELPKRKSTPNKDILMACRLRSQKNVHMAIKAFAEFHKNHSDYRLVVYGEGEQLDELKALTKQLKVADNVVFPGHVDDIHDKMSECAIYLSTSDYEGLSNSMIEAMAIGVPSICTDCPVGGAKMMIKNNVNGILIPVGDVNACTEALCKIADNPSFANKIGKNAEKIKYKLAVSEICPKWEDLL